MAVRPSRGIISTPRRKMTLLGDIRQRLGDPGGSRAAWQEWARRSTGVPEKPSEMPEHALLLQRLGREAEARQLSGQLAAMGLEQW